MTADEFLDIMKPQYAEKGSNRRFAEECTVAVLKEFLFKVEGGQVVNQSSSNFKSSYTTSIGYHCNSLCYHCNSS